MTNSEFNSKWGKYLEEGHYGLDINDERVTEYLDKEFQKLSKLPIFKYYQIKLKFGTARFYADGVDRKTLRDIEDVITLIVRSDG